MAIKPMLAHKHQEHEKKVKDWRHVIIQPKFDGIRATFNVSEQTFMSRTPKPLNTPKTLFSLLQTHSGAESTVTLDGELIVPGVHDFNEVSSIVKRDKSTHIRGEEICFVIFDCYDTNNPDMPYHERRSYLEERFAEANYAECHKFGFERSRVMLSPESPFPSHEVDSVLDLYECDGWEGVMLRDPDSLYKVSGRSTGLLKLKPWKYVDVIVTGMEEGKRRLTGTMGALVCKMPDGSKFNVGTGFSDQDRHEWWADKQIKRSNITVKYQELSNKGIPRFPVLECVL